MFRYEKKGSAMERENINRQSTLATTVIAFLILLTQ